MPEKSRKAMFSIYGVQRGAQGIVGSVEMVTQGEVTFMDDGKKVLAYHESEASGLEGHITRLSLEGNAVSLRRDGQYGVTMRFETGKQTLSLYETPFGVMNISVVGNRVYHNIGDKGGKVRLRYIVGLNGEDSYENVLNIDVRFQDGDSFFESDA